jgi:hypothetical protein
MELKNKEKEELTKKLLSYMMLQNQIHENIVRFLSSTTRKNGEWFFIFKDEIKRELLNLKMMIDELLGIDL